MQKMGTGIVLFADAFNIFLNMVAFLLGIEDLVIVLLQCSKIEMAWVQINKEEVRRSG